MVDFPSIVEVGGSLERQLVQSICTRMETDTSFIAASALTLNVTQTGLLSFQMVRLEALDGKYLQEICEQKGRVSAAPQSPLFH
jgi:hypothetical protein